LLHVDPVNAPTLNVNHIKYIVYKAMPTQWQVHFVQTHRGIALVTLLKLQNFMSNEKSFADGVQSATGKSVANCNHLTSSHQERRPMACTGRRNGRNFNNRENAQIKGTCGHISSMVVDHGGLRMDTTPYVASMEATYGQTAMTIHKDKIIAHNTRSL
jgi:hypothetical protein